VVAREGEDRVGRRPDERRVDDVLDAGLDGRVDEVEVLPAAIRRLGGGDHEEGPDAREGVDGRRALPVRRLRHLGAGQPRGALRRPHDQALRQAGLGERRRHRSADVPRGSGDRDGR
jgi:hypothetical protein